MKTLTKTTISSNLILYTNNSDTKTYIVNRLNNTIKSTSSSDYSSYTLALFILGLAKVQVINNSGTYTVGQLELNEELTKAV